MSGTSDSDTGIDRRSALKKAAVAGAIGWVAPAILSDTAHAVEVLPGGCTAKCQPNGNATVSIQVVIADCIEGTPPGQQVVRGTVTQLSAGGDPCPCGGGVVQIVNPTPDEVVILSPVPGNWDGVLSIGVNITCFDRSLNEIVVNCNTTVQAGAGSGNCESRAGDVYTVENLPVGPCGLPTCPA